jgi:hypothetical protein
VFAVKPIRSMLALCAPVGVLLLLAGCGQGGSSAEPKPLDLELTESGDTASFSGAPREVPAGLARISLKNDGKGPHDAQLVRVDGEQSVQEVLQAIGRAIEGGPLPGWLHPAGGVGTTGPGQSVTAVQPLEEGTHYIFDTEGSEGSPTKGAQAKFEVKGGGGGAEPPRAPATVTASEYKFETSGLKPGKNRVRFENAGQEPHHVIMAPIKRGKTIDDVREFARTEKGDSPIEEEKTVGTSVVDGGMSQVVELELQKGKHAALCFITDRRGGPPHVAKGMAMEVDLQ